MTEETADIAVEALDALGFEVGDSEGQWNMVHRYKEVGPDLTIEVWGRHWSDLFIQLKNPSNVESVIGIYETSDDKKLIAIVSALIQCFESIKHLITPSSDA